MSIQLLFAHPHASLLMASEDLQESTNLITWEQRGYDRETALPKLHPDLSRWRHLSSPRSIMNHRGLRGVDVHAPHGVIDRDLAVVACSAG